MYLAHQLFGGAIVAQLPDGWMDASDARPVPDNQEVWLEPDGAERSVVIEIMESAECADAQSGEVHFHELANGNDALADSVLYSAQLPADALQPTLQAAPAFVVHGVQHLPRDGRNGGRLLPAGTSAALHVSLVVLRLATQKTDILVSINRQLATVVSMPAPSATRSCSKWSLGASMSRTGGSLASSNSSHWLLTTPAYTPRATRARWSVVQFNLG